MRHFQQFFNFDRGFHVPDGKTEVVQTSQAMCQNLDSNRRYRNDVPYILPKDINEEERLNIQHQLFRAILQGNFLAPLEKNPASILDVGSGTGIWGHEIAQQFPTADVFGVDLEPPHLGPSSVSGGPPSPNYHFVQGNILQGLPFPDHTFDFTHQRMLVGAIPARDWPRVIQELTRVTRPGGWIELMEYSDVVYNAGPAWKQLHKWTQDACLAQGIDLSQARDLGAMLTQAGLRQVAQQPVDIPLGAWDDPIGLLMERDALVGYGALKPALCKLFALEPAEFDRQMTTAQREWKEQHAFMRFFLAYGQVLSGDELLSQPD